MAFQAQTVVPVAEVQVGPLPLVPLPWGGPGDRRASGPRSSAGAVASTASKPRSGRGSGPRCA
eukprot:8266080-Alexandrium_andersonii.AAC.1